MMRTDLDHLPAAKQEWKKRGRIDKIILYGSYARGGWVDEPHTAKGYQSDFDLLFIVNDKRLTGRVDYWLKLEDRLNRELAITKTLHTPVNFIVHTLQEVNDGLAHGRFFFMDVRRDGIALQFHETALFAKQRGWSKKAAFLMHQATENLYHSVLLVATF